MSEDYSGYKSTAVTDSGTDMKIIEKQVEDGIAIFISDGTEEKKALHMPDDTYDDLKAMVKNDEKVKAFLHKLAMDQVK